MAEQSWHAERYDQQMAFVSRFGEQVLDWLGVSPGERVVDLGCGTGDLADVLHRAGAVVIGLDASEEMVRLAQSKYPDVTFLCEDGQQFELAAEVDAVFSNAALHWMTQPERVLACVWKALRPGGRFVAEFGAKGNVDTVLRAVRNRLEEEGVAVSERWPWFFPSLAEYAMLLERQGFEVRQAACFARPTPLSGAEQGLANWLDTFASPLFAGIPEQQKRALYEQIESSLRSSSYDSAKGWTADYRRLRICAIKP